MSAIHPEDQSRVQDVVERARASGSDMDLEWRTIHPDGSVHWLMSRCHAERDEQGRAQRYIGVTLDITARKAMEHVLRHNEERFRLLLDHAPTALAMFDRDMRYLAASRRWLDDYGLDSNAIMGRCHYDVFPEISESLKVVHRRALAGETVHADEDRFVRADGSVQWLRWEVLPWHMETGEVGGIVIFSEDITARKHAELEKNASQAKLAAALESMTDAIFISDTAGRFLDFNEAFATFHKFLNKEACARTFAEYPDILDVCFPDGTLAPIEQWAVPRALRGETATNVEYGLRRKDTGERWTGSYSFAPLRDESGAIVGSVVVARDITEQKRAERELRISEEKFQKMFNAAPVLMSLTSLDAGEYLDVNRRFCEVSGFAREEALGKSYRELGWIAPEAREEVLGMMRARGRANNLPLTLHTRDGKPVHCLYSGERIQIGEQAALLSIALDVTETREKEQALRESEIRFRELFEHAPVAVWLEDMSKVGTRFAELRAQGIMDLRSHLEAYPELLRDLAASVCVVEVNAASLKLFGATSADELAHELPKYFNGEALTVFREEMVALYEGKTKFEAEACRLDMRGNVLDIQLRLSVLPGSTSDLARVLVSFADLTARKTAEAERRKLEREINHLQRLESLGRLASGVSHDMNNVLCIIMTVASLLKSRERQDAEIAKDADLLVQTAERGRDLVKGLRDFSRKELQSASELDLNDMARREAELLERTTLKRVNILLDLAPELPRILGERTSIQTALMNLCVNAVDAMPNRGTLTLITRNLGHGFVELAVKDDGEGMPPEVLARALEPFFTTKPMGKGTGLGLSQVYGTVKAHGGTLDIASKPGMGTRVSMAFPSLQLLAPVRDAGAAEALPPARALDILLVDDEEMIRGSVLSLLQVLGHRAQAASNGLEALRRLDAGMQVDLVMLDINMPGMDGIETLSRLRIAHPQLKVLFATGHVDERIPSILGRFPDVHILKKPFNITELAQALRDW